MFGVQLPESAPMWLVVVAIVVAAAIPLGMVLVRAIQAVMPQESSDRLAWWTNRRKFKDRRGREVLRGRRKRKCKKHKCKKCRKL